MAGHILRESIEVFKKVCLINTESWLVFNILQSAVGLVRRLTFVNCVFCFLQIIIL